MTKALLAAITVALVLTPGTLAGSIRMHVSGSGGGTIRLWPGGQQPCRAETPMLSGGCIYYDFGGGLIFQATPDPGSTFDGWPYPQCYLFPGGYCQMSGPQGASCCFDLSVSFSKLRYTLTVGTAGTGRGAVASSPSGIDCGTFCSATYDWNTSVTLTPQPAVGSKFTGWTGACSGIGACTVTLAAAASVTAVFDLDNFPVVVSKTGTGRGVITSSPTGISCGDRCNTPFIYGSLVTLTATAATGSHFAGWSGPCSGTGECAPTIGAGPTTVGARFDAVTVTARLHGRTLTVALYAERASTLTIALSGPSRYTIALRLRPGRAAPSLPLPKRLPPGRYTARFLIRDGLGAATLNTANLQLR
jgi:List-Bact-rpt repeat protein